MRVHARRGVTAAATLRHRDGLFGQFERLRQLVAMHVHLRQQCGGLDAQRQRRALAARDGFYEGHRIGTATGQQKGSTMHKHRTQRTGVPLAEREARALRRLAQRHLGIDVGAEAEHADANSASQFGVQPRRQDRAAFEPGPSLLQQCQRRGLGVRPALRIGAFEDRQHELLDLQCSIGLLPCLDGLRHRDDGGGHDGGHGGGRQTYAEAMPPDELAQPIGRGIRAGTDGVSEEPSAQILGERVRGRIAVAGLLLEALGQYRIQVAAQFTPQRAGRGVVARARRLGLGDRSRQLKRVTALQAVGAVAGEQLIRENGKAVEVAGRADRLPTDQFRARVLHRHRPPGLARQRPVVGVVRADQLSDAEIEQVHLAIVRDHDVARLDVAVNHTMRMCEGHGIEHLDEQLDALAQVGAARRAPTVDRFAVDVLEREVRACTRVDTGVVEPRDARVL